MHIIGCLLMGVFLGLFLLLGVARLAIHSFLGFFFPQLRHRQAPYDQRSGESAQRTSAHADTSAGSTTASHTKIFEKNDDEYVDFEDIKDEPH